MKKPIYISALTIGLGILAIGFAESGNSAPVTIDASYLKECGACHVPYPAQFLPKRSWERIIGGLDKHFGENAALSPQALQPIKAYLDRHAADSPLGNPRIMRDVEANKTPVRITEMPFWIHIHRKQIDRKLFDTSKVKSASNCGACHRGAAKGQFGDDD